MRLIRTISFNLIFLFVLIITWESLAQSEDGNREKRNRNESKVGREQNLQRTNSNSKVLNGNIVLGAPTANSILINIIADNEVEAFCMYGLNKGRPDFKTKIHISTLGNPIEMELSNLENDKEYFYKISLRREGQTAFEELEENSFHTCRNPESTFSFGIQGDSHPERVGKMFNHELYFATMKNAGEKKLDFYFMMGDDFSLDRLIQRNQISQAAVNDVYLNQRQYVGLLAKQTPLFLVNGNHEQGAKYLLDGTENNAAVCAALARKKIFPLPIPNEFYTGDKDEIPNVGLLEDYYAFEWGNALFVVIDPYWHSEEAVDNVPGERGRKRILWMNSLGQNQYSWFKSTLENSKAKYKFVFSHHVLGTGRGGIELAKLFEWGGYNQKGEYEFDKMRPNWKEPIHQLMVKNKVTIFFQGHDHLFAKQDLDGIVYQSVPNPADNTYTAFNSEAYKSGDVLPNSGFLNVTVSNLHVKVEYIRSFLSKDETENIKNGMVSFSYTIK